MENYLVLNGQKIELTPEQYQQVCNAVSAKEKKTSIFNKEYHKVYFYITDRGEVSTKQEKYELADILHYLNANYCRNEKLMRKRANYEAFERVLWRFSEENGGSGIYSIWYHPQTKTWNTIHGMENAVIFGPTFCSQNIAWKAIDMAKEWLSEWKLEPEDVFF